MYLQEAHVDCTALGIVIHRGLVLTRRYGELNNQEVAEYRRDGSGAVESDVSGYVGCVYVQLSAAAWVKEQ